MDIDLQFLQNPKIVHSGQSSNYNFVLCPTKSTQERVSHSPTTYNLGRPCPPLSSLSEVAPQKYDLSQVHELPPWALQVIEHQAEVKYCEHFQILSQGVFPTDVTNVVQYGSSLKGLMVYWMDAQRLPLERTSEFLEDVFGCQVSEGTLCNVRTTCAQKLEPIEAQIKSSIEQAVVGHFVRRLRNSFKGKTLVFTQHRYGMFITSGAWV